MSSPELDGLLVEHLADLDQASARIFAIQKVVFTAMGERAREWAERNGWCGGEFDYSDDGGWANWDAWVAPPDWRTADTVAEQNKFDGKFGLMLGDGDTGWGEPGEDWFYLTRLCQVAKGQIGFQFFRPASVKVKLWKQAVPRLREIVPHPPFVGITAIKEHAFFLQFRIDPVTLAAALRDGEPGAALAPFEAALDALLEAKPAFDEVLQHLKSLSG